MCPFFMFSPSSTVLVTTLPLPPAPPTLQLQAANQNSLKLAWHRKQDKGCTYTLEMKQTNERCNRMMDESITAMHELLQV